MEVPISRKHIWILEIWNFFHFTDIFWEISISLSVHITHRPYAKQAISDLTMLISALTAQ
jgi:hypothetical protein